MTPTRFLTLSDIARRLNVAKHRVRWVLQVESIHPVALTGTVPGYDEATVESVRRGLSRSRRMKVTLTA